MDTLAATISEIALGCPPDSVRNLGYATGVNKVWEIKIGGDFFILRANSQAGALQTYDKESWCIGQAAKAGVPGATILGTGTFNEFGWMAQTKIEGIAGDAFTDDPVFLWHEMGRFAALINTIKVSGYGHRFAPDQKGVFTQSWKEMLDKRLGDLFNDNVLVRSGILTADENIRAYAALEELYDWNYKPSLAHNDLLPKNAIIGPDSVVNIIDYGDAAGGRAPYSELMHIAAWNEKPHLIAAFREGYGIKPDVYEAMKSDLSRLVLLRAFTAAFWGYRDSLGHRHGVMASARQRYQEILGDGTPPPYLAQIRLSTNAPHIPTPAP